MHSYRAERRSFDPAAEDTSSEKPTHDDVHGVCREPFVHGPLPRCTGKKKIEQTVGTHLRSEPPPPRSLDRTEYGPRDFVAISQQQVCRQGQAEKSDAQRSSGRH